MKLATLAAITIPVIVTIPIPGRAHAQIFSRDRYTEPRNATVETRGARRIEVEAGAGYLHITGRSGLSDVRVRGTARASRESWLDEIKLIAERRGDAVLVKVEIPELRVSFGNDERSLDLDIEVPSDLPVEAEDGSGDVIIRGVAALRMNDGSGDLEITDVDGPVEVKDGSGDLTIRHVRGDVSVRDGSGDITIDDVTGAVEVPDDGSGDVRIDRVTRGVHVGSDGSGSITVSDVGGDFVVDHDGSGGIDYHGVRGSVDLPRKHRRGDR